MPHNYKTAISFGLVYVPVTLHACVRSKEISFNQLYKKTMQRIQYKKSCENCPAHIASEDIVKGYQYEKDKYIVLSDDEMEKIKSKKDKSIVITEFVKLQEIDPVYFEKSYYVQPTSAENAFQLIAAAIEKENKVGIAKTVLGTKEQLVALRVHKGQMLLYTMHFADEVQTPPPAKAEYAASAKELALAKTVIDNMSAKFEPDSYKNEYREKLLEAIEAKINGQEIKTPKAVRSVSVSNLMDALKKSVEETAKKSAPKSSAKTAKSPSGKKSAASKNAVPKELVAKAPKKSGGTGAAVH